ncbi:MAG: UDP-3-O-(3-hydroxymyristoyl)glucosamine N-acyltransferase [Gammaproteobacteria bacterium]|nr:UDP-3-O-(3-hydroxymyristoyl)glucosamine N-acyltransferase [Gammaproteobacteria bacterium]
MTTTVADIVSRFPELLSVARGDGAVEVAGPASAERARAGAIVFAGNETLFARALEGPAAVIVASAALIDGAPQEGPARTFLACDNAELAMALVCRAFFPETANRQPFDGQRVHTSAAISASAELAPDVVVGPHAVIGAHTRVGAGCVIGGNTHIEANASIGEGTHIHPHVFIAHGTVIGRRCEVHPMSSLGTEGYGYAHDAEFNHYRLVHYGRLIVEDDVHIGAGVFIDRGRFDDTVIGAGTKIDNYCHIAHNVRIGRNCLITGGFGAAGSVTIGEGNVFGGRVSITDHVTIGDRMMFAGLSAISKNVDEPGGKFGGYPLQPIADFLKTNATIAQLPRMRKQIDQLMRKLGLK